MPTADGPLISLPPGPSYRIFKGASGAILLRPWFDRLALWGITRVFFPVSRAWAEAVAANGDFERFKAGLGPVSQGLRDPEMAIATVARMKQQFDAALSRWDAAYFGPDNPGAKILVALEIDRARAAYDLMASRRVFLPIRRKVDPVKWDVSAPAEVFAAHSDRLNGDATAFPPPPDTAIEESHKVPGPLGPEFWARMKSPVAGDTAWARIYLPESEQVQGALILLHGIGMEPDMWGALAAPAKALLSQGIALICPEAPWHGRRCPVGSYGGEQVLARGPLGFIELFQAWVAENALWVGWARDRGFGRVAVGGISMGALTAQLVATAAGAWPEKLRPDGILLVTSTGNITGAAMEGSLTAAVGFPDALVQANWSEADLSELKPLLEPLGIPALSPDRIVMVLGKKDTVTPFTGGMALARQWNLPKETLFVTNQGHFSASLGLYRDPRPLQKIADILLN